MGLKRRKTGLGYFFHASALTLFSLLSLPSYADDAMGDNFTGIINFHTSSKQVEPQDNTKETLIHQVLPHPQGSFIHALDHNELGLIGFSPLEEWGVRLWDKKSGRLLRRYGYRIGPSMMQRSPLCTLKSGSHWVAMGCNQGTPLTLLDLTDGKEITLPEVRDTPLTPLAAKQNMLVTRGFENNIEIHPYHAPGTQALRIENFPGDLRALAVSEKYVAGGLSDHSIRVWDIHTGKQIHHLQGHTYDVTALAIVDGKVVSAAGNRNVDKSLKVWDLATGQLLKTVEMPAYYAASTLKQQGDKLISYGSGEGGEIVIWNWPEMKPEKTLDGAPVDDFAYFQNHLYTPNENTIQVIDPNTNTPIKTLKGFKDRILALDANAKYFVAAGLDGSIYNLDQKTGAIINTLKTDADIILNVWLNGSRVFSRSKDESIEVWDLETGKRLYQKRYEDQHLLTGALSQNFAVTTAYAQKIDLWDIHKKTLSLSFSDLPGFVSAADTDGTRLLLGYASGNVDTYVKNTVSNTWPKQTSEKPFSAPIIQIKRTPQHRILGSLAGDIELQTHGKTSVFKLEGLIENVQLLDDPILNAAIVTQKADDNETVYEAFTLKKSPDAAQATLHSMGKLETPALVLQPNKTWVSGYDQPIPIEKKESPQAFNAAYDIHQTKVAALNSFLSPNGEIKYTLRWFDIGQQTVKTLPSGSGGVEHFRLINTTAIVDTEQEISRFDLVTGKKTSSIPKHDKLFIRLYDKHEVHFYANGEIHVFALESGKPVAHFKEHHSQIVDLEIQGSHAISRDQDKKICFWNILDAHKTQCLRFKPDEPVYTTMMRTGPAVQSPKGMLHYYNSRKKHIAVLNFSHVPKVDPERLYLLNPTQNADYLTGLVRTQDNGSSLIAVWDLESGVLKNTIDTEPFYNDNDAKPELFGDVLALGYVSYAEEQPKRVVEFWNVLKKQSFLKIPGLLTYSSSTQAIIADENEVSVMTFDQKQDKPYTLKKYKGQLLSHDEHFIWIFAPDQKSVLGIDKKTFTTSHRVAWDKPAPKFKGFSQGTVFLEDDKQTLSLLSTAAQKAVDTDARWFFFPTAFLSQKSDGSLLQQGDAKTYVHWLKNGNVRELE